jgi:hypothetical protein
MVELRTMCRVLDSLPQPARVACSALLHYSTAASYHALEVPPGMLDHYGLLAFEVKKLALAAIGAEDTATRMQLNGGQPNRADLLVEEAKTQMGAHALGHILEPAQHLQAASSAQAEIARREQAHEDFSKAAVLAQEMEKLADPQRQAEFGQALVAQPLTQMVVRNEELLRDMAPTLHEDQPAYVQLLAAANGTIVAFGARLGKG